jgi:imidazoleglycerol phosphate synthase glutamine amidotransferase subunit HisH
MLKIVIVDYGMGNLRSVQKAFETCGCNAELSRNARTVEDADALVVPGVGSFGDCVENLDRFGLKGGLTWAFAWVSRSFSSQVRRAKAAGDWAFSQDA